MDLPLEQTHVLGIIRAGRDQNRLVLEQVRQERDVTSGWSPAIEMPVGSTALAALGHADGEGAALDLVLWIDGDEHSSPLLEVVRLDERGSRVIASTNLPASMVIGARSQLVMADLVPEIAGEEIILTGEERLGNRMRMLVYSGAARGRLRPLRSLYALGRRGPRVAAAFAVAEVAAEHPGRELVVGRPNGQVLAYGIGKRRLRHLRAFEAFPDPPHCSASRLVTGDLIPARAGDEIAIGDDGARGDAHVRVFDGRGRLITEFQAFSGDAPAGVELWIGDVVPGLPGAELLVGKGPAGGDIQVFSLGAGTASHVADLPLARATSLQRHLTIANLLPELPGLEVAVAQVDSDQSVQILSFASGRGQIAAELLDDRDPIVGIFGD
jgi:hypothetical protein